MTKITPEDLRDEVIRLSKHCETCGAQFELRYNRRTGAGAQFWPSGCGPQSDCFKRLMPPSDFESETMADAVQRVKEQL